MALVVGVALGVGVGLGAIVGLGLGLGGMVAVGLGVGVAGGMVGVGVVGGMVGVGVVGGMVAVGLGVGVTPPPQVPLTLNTMCMFGNPIAAVVVGVLIPQPAALR